jgi:signal transduction histidine kinase/ActR/RegA family two-component response regulator
METTGILHDEKNAYKLLNLTCDTLLLIRNDGVCMDLILRTELPYVSDHETLVGKNIFDVFPGDTAKELRPEFEAVVQHGIVSNKNYDLPAPDKMYYFKCIMQRYDFDHVLFQYRDITRRSQMKKQLQLMNQRLQETEKAAQIGQWIYDTSNDIIKYAGFADARYSGSETYLISFHDYLQKIHPDDTEGLKKILLNSDENKLLDYRIPGEETTYMRIKVTESYIEKEHVMTGGYVQNITDLIEKRNELEMVTLAVNNSNDNIYATYLDGRMIFANKLCRAQNQIDPNIDITQYKAYEILDNIKTKDMWDKFVAALLKNNNMLQYVCKQPYPDYNIIASDCTSYIVKNGKGEDVIWSFRRDISEQLRYEEELVKAKEKAEESDRLKSAFLSNMSHEIRTPLNAIVGFSGIIADTEDSEERKSYYKIVETNNERLLQLISEILDLSKIESGVYEFTYASVALNDLCHELLTMHQVACKKAKLVLDPSPADTVLISDKNRMIQIFSNLINNAIKFTPMGEIHFGYRPFEKEVEFYVKDTGIGIAPDKMDKVFERFVKVDTFAPGTGLGLAICKTIVEKLGGSISVVSTLGKGTTFTFKLPYVRPSSQIEKQENIDAALNIVETEPTSSILVVEDIFSNFKLIKAILGSKYKLTHATTGIEAIDFFHKYNPDLILMDIKIPKIDGLEVTRMIRDQSKDIPIIAVSAYAYEEEKKRAFEAGCNDFISKPVNKVKLLETVKFLLKKEKE